AGRLSESDRKGVIELLGQARQEADQGQTARTADERRWHYQKAQEPLNRAAGRLETAINDLPALGDDQLPTSVEFVGQVAKPGPDNKPKTSSLHSKRYKATLASLDKFQASVKEILDDKVTRRNRDEYVAELTSGLDGIITSATAYVDKHANKPE